MGKRSFRSKPGRCLECQHVGNAGGWSRILPAAFAIVIGLLGLPDRSRQSWADELDFGPVFNAGQSVSTEERSIDPEAEKDADECRDALNTLRDDRLSYIDLDIRVSGRAGNDYPRECRLEGDDYEARHFATTTFTWKAAGYCHKPLYFEQWNLERYGHSRGLVADMFLSGAHFFATVPILPYKMGVELPWECVYPVGYYRPGSCAPWTVPAIPVSPRGLAIEAATATGAVFLLP